jgi:hypothetical protein
VVFLIHNLHFILIKHGSSFHGYINSQNNRFCSKENALAVHKVPLSDLAAGGVWCAVGA